jgi:hypothetical protein
VSSESAHGNSPLKAISPYGATAMPYLFIVFKQKLIVIAWRGYVCGSGVCRQWATLALLKNIRN